MNRIGAIMVTGGLLLTLAACSRTSDGTIVMDQPVDLPGLNLVPPKPAVPSWLKFKSAKPEPVGSSFPPPPATKAAPRRKLQPPVVATSSGKLDCRNQTEGGRVRMVCE
ncbi:MAG: hypothetical protein NTV73_05495 [Hyphomicrobiales bacterium]|nr:hypothetical protein [Hyphomicrobiales bacterium]